MLAHVYEVYKAREPGHHSATLTAKLSSPSPARIKFLNSSVHNLPLTMAGENQIAPQPTPQPYTASPPSRPLRAASSAA